MSLTGYSRLSKAGNVSVTLNRAVGVSGARCRVLHEQRREVGGRARDGQLTLDLAGCDDATGEQT